MIPRKENTIGRFIIIASLAGCRSSKNCYPVTPYRQWYEMPRQRKQHIL